ncbi:MAG: hypothetical protein IJ837_02210 [Clostridia bacterium]|nr:hypothetical protein [Clostridia bacterium]
MKTLKVEDLDKIIDYNSHYEYELMIELDFDDKIFNLPAKALLNNEDLIATLHNITMSDYDKYSDSWLNVCNELYRKGFKPSWNLTKKLYETESFNHMLNSEVETTLLLVDKQRMVLNSIKHFENTDDNDLEILDNIIKIEKNNPKIKINPEISDDTSFYSRSWFMPYNMTNLHAIYLLTMQEIEGIQTGIKVIGPQVPEIKDCIELVKSVVYYEKLKNCEKPNNHPPITATECLFVFLKNSLFERDKFVKEIKNLQNEFIEKHNLSEFKIIFEKEELPKQEILEDVYDMDKVIIYEFNRILKTPAEKPAAVYDEKNDVIKLKLNNDFNSYPFVPDENPVSTTPQSKTIAVRDQVVDYVDSCISNQNQADWDYLERENMKNEANTITK